MGDESVITLDSEGKNVIQKEDEEKTDSTIRSFEILAPNVTIPGEETTYWCSVHKLPAFEERVHGVGFDGVIATGSKGLVHHIEVKQYFSSQNTDCCAFKINLSTQIWVNK